MRHLLSRLLKKSRPALQSQGLTISPDVHASPHEDGLVLLDVPHGQVFVCNRTAARIWRGLAEGRDAEAVSLELSQHYGVDAGLARQHTSAFIANLERRGFVNRAEG